MNRERERIAVIGSGIAGLACAHVLGPHHEVVLYEAADRLGGHANTVDVHDPVAGTIPVDTGFIVHNDRNYPNLVRLFQELDVTTFDTEMSFAVTDRDPASPSFGLSYRATSPNTLFADRRNLVRSELWRMLADITRFYRAANRFLAEPDPSTTLERFLEQHGFSREFVELHLIPLGSAVWSADPSTFGRYPALALFRFLSNHGLLGWRDRPQWRSIAGGSRAYVDAIAARFPGTIRTGTPVIEVSRPDERDGVLVRTRTDSQLYTRVILAVHSDQALQLLANPTPAERKVLGAVKYQPNRATLHTDIGLLPPNRRAWASWNYDRRHPDQRDATLTYDLTTLQQLPGSQRYLVSLNSDELIDPARVVASFDYDHPVFDLDAIEAQRLVGEIDGADRVHYCGAWCGNGFHEDGIVAALQVCKRLGVNW